METNHLHVKSHDGLQGTCANDIETRCVTSPQHSELYLRDPQVSRHHRSSCNEKGPRYDSCRLSQPCVPDRMQLGKHTGYQRFTTSIPQLGIHLMSKVEK